MNLLNYIIRRILIAIPILLGVIIITFFISRAFPGDVVMLRMPEKFTLEMYESEKARLGLDQPIYVQFFVYMCDLLTGNWGYSFTIVRESKVWDILWQRIPRSLELTIISMCLAIIIGIRLGIFSAKNENTLRDKFIRANIYLGASIPGFWIALLIVMFFLLTGITIFPLFGFKSLGMGDPPAITHFRIIDCIISGRFEILADYLWHLVLPVTSMTIIQLVIITKQVRGSMIDILQMDYIRTAWAKGCTEHMVFKKHALKNSLLPMISVSTMAFPKVFAAVIPLEYIFDLDEIGQLFLGL